MCIISLQTYLYLVFEVKCIDWLFLFNVLSKQYFSYIQGQVISRTKRHYFTYDSKDVLCTIDRICLQYIRIWNYILPNMWKKLFYYLCQQIILASSLLCMERCYWTNVTYEFVLLYRCEVLRGAFRRIQDLERY